MCVCVSVGCACGLCVGVERGKNDLRNDDEKKTGKGNQDQELGSEEKKRERKREIEKYGEMWKK